MMRAQKIYAKIELKLKPLSYIGRNSPYSGAVMENKAEFYAELEQKFLALVAGEGDLLANLANTSALLFDALNEINWLGFYLVKGTELVLGPFQGKPACLRIAKGKGVCGTSWQLGQTLRIDNVHEFPGHIACDSASQSELVIPIFQAGEVYGVLDIDSPKLARFDIEDMDGLEAFCRSLESQLMGWV